MNKEEFNRLWAIRLANWLESKGFIKTAMLIILLFNPLALIIYLSLVLTAFVFIFCNGR